MKSTANQPRSKIRPTPLFEDENATISPCQQIQIWRIGCVVFQGENTSWKSTFNKVYSSERRRELASDIENSFRQRHEVVRETDSLFLFPKFLVFFGSNRLEGSIFRKLEKNLGPLGIVTICASHWLWVAFRKLNGALPIVRTVSILAQKRAKKELLRMFVHPIPRTVLLTPTRAQLGWNPRVRSSFEPAEDHCESVEYGNFSKWFGLSTSNDWVRSLFFYCWVSHG